MREEEFDVPRMLMRGAQTFQVYKKLGFLITGQSLFRFHAEQRFFHSGLTQTDQCRARHERMLVEHTFAVDREKIAILGANPMRLATTEPEPAFRIEVSEVTHAMPDAAGAWITNFGQLRGAFALIIGACDLIT